MLRSLLIGCVVVLAVGCTEGAQGVDAGAGATPAATSAGVHLGAAAHPGVKMTPQIRACRAACWDDIPFNACAEQRDACLAGATTGAAKRHCRHMSHTCRKQRRTCLQGCWVTGVPTVAPPEADVVDDDAPEAE